MSLMATAMLVPCVFVLAVVLMNMLLWPRIPSTEGGALPPVAVLIPARNEEHRLGPCLEAVLAQGAPVVEVLVYDDNSSDGTRALAEQFRERDPRIRVIDGVPLPQGWCGKPFACAQLAQHAASEWLLFLDADTLLAERAVADMLHEALKREVTLLSCWPGLICESFWERALMPMLNFCVFTLFPAPLAVSRNDPSMGLAHGACLLMQREAYRAVGGHQTVRDEIFEDTFLARAWRARGFRTVCLDGQDVARVRMYSTFGDIWRGFQKNYYPAFRHHTGFVLFLLFHAWCFLLPFVMIPVALATRGPWETFAAVSLLVVLIRALMGLRFGYPAWSSVLHPLAEVLLLALGLTSWWKCRSGLGVEWKGRRYRTKQDEDRP